MRRKDTVSLKLTLVLPKDLYQKCLDDMTKEGCIDFSEYIRHILAKYHHKS